MKEHIIIMTLFSISTIVKATPVYNFNFYNESDQVSDKSKETAETVKKVIEESRNKDFVKKEIDAEKSEDSFVELKMPKVKVPKTMAKFYDFIHSETSGHTFGIGYQINDFNNSQSTVFEESLGNNSFGGGSGVELFWQIESRTTRNVRHEFSLARFSTKELGFLNNNNYSTGEKGDIYSIEEYASAVSYRFGYNYAFYLPVRYGLFDNFILEFGSAFNLKQGNVNREVFYHTGYNQMDEPDVPGDTDDWPEKFDVKITEGYYQSIDTDFSIGTGLSLAYGRLNLSGIFEGIYTRKFQISGSDLGLSQDGIRSQLTLRLGVEL